MNALKGLSIKITSNGNYGLYVNNSEVLCFNKRLVQVGVGASIVYKTLQFYKQKESLEIIPLVIGTSIVWTLRHEKVYKALFLTSLIFSSLIMNNGAEIHYTDFLLMNILFVNCIGLGVIPVSCCSLALGGSALFIKQFGTDGMIKKLQYINQLQDKITVQLKQNGKYSLSVLNNEFLSFKESLLRAGIIFSAFVISIIDFEIGGSFLLSNLIGYGLGILTIYSQLNDYGLTYLFFVGALNVINNARLFFLHMFFTKLIGKAVVVTGFGFAILAAISLLAKKSQNNQLVKLAEFIDSLKDKSKLKEYKQTNDRDAFLEMRKNWLKVNNNTEYNNLHQSKADDPQKVYEKVERSKEKNKKEIIKEEVVKKNKEQIGYSKNITKRYTINLKNNKHKKTWDKLFDIKTSKPEHLAINGSKIKPLIEALGGQVKEGSKRNQILFKNKNLGFYEVTHGGGEAGFLTSGYAQRIKEALEKAIDSGYVSKELVAVNS